MNPNPLDLVLNDSGKTVVIIDGSNLYATIRHLGLQVDYKLLRQLFDLKCDLLRIYYHTAILETDKEDTPNPLIPLVDWLSYNGYATVTKPAKEIRFMREGKDIKKVKGNVDVAISLNMIEMADVVNHIVLISGDGDFVPVVRYVQNKGVKFTVISSLKTQPPMVADELRRVADNFIEIDDLRESISPPKVQSTNVPGEAAE